MDLVNHSPHLHRGQQQLCASKSMRFQFFDYTLHRLLTFCKQFLHWRWLLHNIVVAAHIHLNHLHILCTLCYEQLHLLTGTHSFIRNSLLPSISSTGSLCFFHRIMLINLVCSYCIFDAVMYIQTSSLIRSLQTWCDQRFINKYYNNQTWWAKQIMHNIRNICIWLFYDCNILPQHICIVGHYIIFCAVVAGVVV